MSNRVALRHLTPEEEKQIRRLARSQTAPIRQVQRARIIARMLEDPDLSPTQAGLQAGLSNVVGAKWVRRFNEEGLAGLEDRPRSGRPRTHSEAVRSTLIALVLQKPQSLGYPFALWTLERLQVAFFEREGVHLSDSTIWTWMDEEGFDRGIPRYWKRQESWFDASKKRDPEFAEKKGAVIAAYVCPPPRTRVICVDEMGPISAKTYPGAEWKTGPQRATFEPDYGRRGKLWVHGAFEPATGEATLLVSPGRDSASHIRLLEKMIEAFPSDRWLVVEDNLSIHTSQETKLALLAWPEIQLQFLPKYAPWLNLIEPWWKQLRSLALKGRRFERAKELEEALFAALAYWNAHRYPYTWKKHPQDQVLVQYMLIGGYGVSYNVHP